MENSIGIASPETRVSQTNGTPSSKSNSPTQPTLSLPLLQGTACELLELELDSSGSTSLTPKTPAHEDRSLKLGIEKRFFAGNFLASFSDTLALTALFTIYAIGGPPGGYNATYTVALPVVLSLLLLPGFMKWTQAGAWLDVSLVLRAVGCTILPALLFVPTQDIALVQSAAILILSVLCSIHYLASSAIMRQSGLPFAGSKNYTILPAQLMAIAAACLINHSLYIDPSSMIKVCTVLYLLALYACLEARITSQKIATSGVIPVFFPTSIFATAAKLSASAMSAAAVCIIFAPLALLSLQNVQINRSSAFIDLFCYTACSFTIGYWLASRISATARPNLPSITGVVGLVSVISGLALLGTLGLGEFCRTAFFAIGLGSGLSTQKMEVGLPMLAPEYFRLFISARAALVLSLAFCASAMAESNLPVTSPSHVLKALALFAFALACIALMTYLCACAAFAIKTERQKNHAR